MNLSIPKTQMLNPSPNPPIFPFLMGHRVTFTPSYATHLITCGQNSRSLRGRFQWQPRWTWGMRWSKFHTWNLGLGMGKAEQSHRATLNDCLCIYIYLSLSLCVCELSLGRRGSPPSQQEFLNEPATGSATRWWYVIFDVEIWVVYSNPQYDRRVEGLENVWGSSHHLSGSMLNIQGTCCRIFSLLCSRFGEFSNHSSRVFRRRSSWNAWKWRETGPYSIMFAWYHYAKFI